jgi:SAM-dependent methyltransferase
LSPTPPHNPLAHERYPRSNRYDPQWVFDNLMGPHPLWLLEALCEHLVIEPGLRVLDLGCGTALTSIFMAKEFGVKVWATDLWIAAEENQARIEAAGVGDLVTAVHAEAHALPFEDEHFDLVVSLDAYHYFGTDDLYIGALSRLIRPGGRIGIVVPGVKQELEAIPEVLAPYWQWDFCSFHSPAWWRRHWDKTTKVRVERADLVPGGHEDWLRFEEATAMHGVGWHREAGAREAAMLRADAGEYLGFVQMVAVKA